MYVYEEIRIIVKTFEMYNQLAISQLVAVSSEGYSNRMESKCGK